MKFIKIFLFFIFVSCFNSQLIDIGINSTRIDQDFSSIDADNYEDKINQIEYDIPGFIDYYLTNHIGMSRMTDTQKKDNILLFTSSLDVIKIQEQLDLKFTDTDYLSLEIENFFQRYLYFFPEKSHAKKIVFINSFGSYGIDLFNNNLIIGLDFYLGNTNPMFNTFYDYLKVRCDDRFLVSDAMEFYLSNQFLKDYQYSNFQEELIFKGKIMYLLSEFLIDTDISCILRYSIDQFDWCIDHERNIWNEVIKMNIMYSSKNSEYRSFFNDAPFTKGMPTESPSRIGYFVGYQIIKKYMNYSNVTLSELMNNTNTQEILLKSKYNP
ncbi:DUF2268 domain-containing putative Zn-dependent protease [bacterium]|nr:DUF2268 domain-containing putative Zn-dependent protease [bacterium]